jgi:uncharacterized membrane protein YphA (DoxX/SURF4 family)
VIFDASHEGRRVACDVSYLIFNWDVPLDGRRAESLWSRIRIDGICNADRFAELFKRDEGAIGDRVRGALIVGWDPVSAGATVRDGSGRPHWILRSLGPSSVRTPRSTLPCRGADPSSCPPILTHHSNATEDPPMITRLRILQSLLDTTRSADFLAPLALRLYLAPVFWMAGTKKLANFESTVQWFGNPDWGLGLPFPTLMAALAAGSETLGAILLLLGLGVRWITMPLMITMAVAALTVHWQNGWLAIAEGAGSLFANDRTLGAIERLDRAKEILREHGHYTWLTENGSLVILNNGIEFAATYFIMLLVLFFIGGGRYLSADDWLARGRLRSTGARLGASCDSGRWPSVRPRSS